MGWEIDCKGAFEPIVSEERSPWFNPSPQGDDRQRSSVAAFIQIFRSDTSSSAATVNDRLLKLLY